MANNAATEAGKHTTIKETGKNINVTKTETDGHLDYTVNLNDDVTLGSADGANIHLDGNNGNVTATGYVQAGNVTVNTNNNGTINNLTNKGWGEDYTITSGQAATEDQLKTVSDKVDSATTEAGKHTTIQENGKNVTVQTNTTEDGHLDYTVNLNDDVTLGSADGANIHLDGNNGNVTATGYVQAGNVTVNTNNNGTINNLTNKGWGEDYTITSGQAATEDQLKTVSDKVDSATTEASKHTTIQENGKNVTVQTNTTEDGHLDYTVNLNDDVTLGSADGANIHLDGNNGNVTVTGYIQSGNVKVDGTTNRITGLSNIEWNSTIADTVEKNENGEAGYAATQGQLKDVYDAINESGGVQYTAGKGIAINDTEISVKTPENGNLNVTDEGVVLKNDITLDSVTANNTINVGSPTGTQVKINGITGQVTGLTNTSLEVDGFATSNRAATEEQLSAMETKVTNADKYITGGTIDTNSGTLKLTGTNGITADITGLTDYQVTSEGSSFSGNKLTLNLKDTLNTSNADKQVVFDGIASIDDVKAATAVVTDGNNITVTSSEDQNDKHKEYTVNLNDAVYLGGEHAASNYNIFLDGTAGIINVGSSSSGKQIKIDGTTGYITGLANTTLEVDGFATSNRAATEEQLNLVRQEISENKGTTYEAGNGITITEATETGKNPTIAVNADGTKGITVSESGVAVNAGDGLAFETAEGVTKGQLKVATGNGLTIDDSKNVGVKLSLNNNIDDSNLEFGTNGGLKLKDNLTGLTSVSSNSVIVGRDVVTDPGNPEMGVTITGQKITGLDTNSITGDEDAVNKAYVDKFFDTDKGLAVQYDNNTKATVTLDNSAGVEIRNVKTADYVSGSTSAANVNLVYSKAGSLNWTTTNHLNGTTNLTDAATILDRKIGNLTHTGTYRLPGTSSTVTDALNLLDSGVGTVDFTYLETPYLSGDYNLTSATDKLARLVGTISTNVGIDIVGSAGSINWGEDVTYISGAKNVVEGMNTLDKTIKGIDDRVTTLEGNTNSIQTFSAMSAPQISTLSALSNMDMSAVNALSTLSADNLATISTLSTEDTPVSNADPATNDSPRLPEDPNTINGDHIVNGELSVKDDAIFDKDVSVGGKLDVKGEANFHSNATFDKDVSIGGTLNMNGNKITGVADGDVSADSTDAINGSQLYAVEQKVDNNSQAINAVGNQVNRLSNRIDKVGAGAAALAALHPLDFDPDDKLSFAAGYGNYAGENAVAVGAFYQPNEDTMFSVGGTFGNDENMVNAGVSFKLGQKSNVSRSRVSMAKELVSLRDEVAQLKALMAHAGILPSNGQFDTSALFPDVPENHWAYEYVHELGRLGILEGYADGNFEGDRMMTRYEMAAIVYRAMQKGVNIDSRMLKEFEPELKLIRVDVVARDDDGNPTIERVRVNEDTQQA
ncbi:YadA-like family protein [Megamonas hypermegale]|uniref:YadA-like family protein n=1 Tax=Megamonas hypermegale TaxID=158847 RepID=UPI0026EE695D|nr:YadA-like family protein [Megamonas hypermegale]